MRVVAVCVVLSMLVSCGAEDQSGVSAVMARRVLKQLQRDGRASVLVNLTVRRGESIRSVQQRALRVAGDDLTLLLRYDNVPALAGVLRPGGLERLLREPGVASVQVDEPGRGHLAQVVPLLQADTVHTAYSWTGGGVRVAVLDSGIDTDHPDLMDDLVAQQCFNDCPGGGNTGSSAEDDHGHGTAVSGIISSKGSVSAVGMAPDAEIVAVRVLDSNIQGAPSRWIAGLDWVLTNLPTLKVQVINMSLGTWTQYPGSCDAQQPALASVIQKLVAQGVVVLASTGNLGASTGIDAPACISGVIGVGATYDVDMGRQPPTGTYPTGCFDATTGPDVIACFTNSSSEMDLVAPGVKITSTYVGGGTITWSGTSLAAPVTAGAAALLLQCKPTLTPAGVETALEQSGPSITDPKNALSFPAINALAAINKGCACVGQPDGTACHDDDLCTTDSCKAGVCMSGPVVCQPLDTCHLAGVCDPSTGACSNPVKPAGSPCDDSDPCTKQDACTAAGGCAGTAYSCTPAQCEASSACDGAGGCTPTYKAAQTACDDSVACTQTDVCDGTGGCAGTAYSCTPTQCETNSACDGTGGCVVTPKADGVSCDDGDACTQTDTCQAGGCAGADPVACPAAAECHEPGSCHPKTGSCDDPLSADGTPCSGGGNCLAGACVVPDVGVPDLGVPDVGVPDAGIPDAGVPDVGVPDVGGVDAGGGDTAAPDAATSGAGANGCSCDLGQSSGGEGGIALLALLLLWRRQRSVLRSVSK